MLFSANSSCAAFFFKRRKHQFLWLYAWHCWSVIVTQKDKNTLNKEQRITLSEDFHISTQGGSHIRFIFLSSEKTNRCKSKPCTTSGSHVFPNMATRQHNTAASTNAIRWVHETVPAWRKSEMFFMTEVWKQFCTFLFAGDNTKLLVISAESIWQSN